MKKNKTLKYILLTIAIICTLLSPIQVLASSYSIPKVQAHAYVVMDANSGKILLKKNATKKIYPASTVKLMTAVVALESKNAGKNITTTKKVLSKIPSDATMLNIPSGVSYSFNSLLHMLLIASAADAAEILAAGTYGSTSKFVKEMNTKAKELNMTHSSFDNTMGLDIGNHYNKTYTTASDFAILARYAMSKKEIRDIVAKSTYTIPKTSKTKSKKIKNTNCFFTTESYSKNLYTIIGTKTGTTNAAGKVLIVTAKDKKGHEVICAFFGNSTRSAMYQDIRELLDYTFRSYKNGTISLSKGFYDTRFTNGEELIRKYYNKGLLSGTEGGEFKPYSKITQESFITTVNAISNAELLVDKSSKKVTILDLAKLLYNTYPLSITEEECNTMAVNFKSKTTISTSNLKKLAALYESNILPDDITYQVDSYLTKEDMVIIADKMISFVKSYYN
jgi:D-alanyl-D-alanine carboxypeptidase